MTTSANANADDHLGRYVCVVTGIPARWQCWVPEVIALREALERGQPLISTGIVLQELLQGFSGPTARASLIERFAALPFVNPDRNDHIDAAELRNHCRRKDVQLGTIDALIAQLCIRHELVLLSTDMDFVHAAKHSPIRVWHTK